MKIVYGKGKKSNHYFMGVCRITYPDDPWIHVNFAKWYYDGQFREVGDRHHAFRASGREQSLKSILRRIKKQNYPKGTRFVFPNWYVGYADVMIIL